MNLLIVTHVFPPLNAIGSQRPYSWAKYWSRFGHTVCVLTTQKESFDGSLDPEFDFSQLESVHIESVKYWPFSRSHSEISSNQPKNFQDNNSKSSPSLLSKIKALTKRIRQNLGMGAVFSVRNLWIKPAVQRGIALHQQHHFDWIISTYGPPAPHLVASQLSQKLNVPWLADYRDLWFGTHYQNAQGPFAQRQKKTEDRALAHAKIITTVSDPLRQQLEERFNKPTFTIENGFDLDEISDIKQSFRAQSTYPKKGGGSEPIHLVYTGTVRTGAQVNQPLFEAIYQLYQQDKSLAQKLKVSFYGAELGEVPELVQAYQLKNIVNIHGLVPRLQALKLQREADALLFLDWKDSSVDGILTGKLFEYLYAGRPILGIGSYAHLAPGKLIQDSGCGQCLGIDINHIANAISTLIQYQSLPYSPNVDLLKLYTREALAQKMLDRILQINSSCS